MENYAAIQEIADKWNLSPRRVQYLCKTNRIQGAQKAGTVWLIPADASKPGDLRIKKAVKAPTFPLDDLKPNFPMGNSFILVKGDLAMNLPEKAPVRNAFPLFHFHGITITISIEEAAQEIFGAFPVPAFF